MSYPPSPDYGQPYADPNSWPVPSPGAGGVPPLDQPHYGIGPVAAVKRALQKYASFSGRASRSEFWWWTLAVNVAVLGLGGLAGGLGVATSPDGGETPGTAAIPLLILLLLVLLALIVPTIAVTVRRLHDAGYSGWLYLLTLIPYLGSLVVLVFCILPSSPAGFRFDRGAQVPAPPYGQPPYGRPPYGG